MLHKHLLLFFFLAAFALLPSVSFVPLGGFTVPLLAQAPALTGGRQLAAFNLIPKGTEPSPQQLASQWLHSIAALLRPPLLAYPKAINVAQDANGADRPRGAKTSATDPTAYMPPRFARKPVYGPASPQEPYRKTSTVGGTPPTVLPAASPPNPFYGILHGSLRESSPQEAALLRAVEQLAAYYGFATQLYKLNQIQTTHSFSSNLEVIIPPRKLAATLQHQRHQSIYHSKREVILLTAVSGTAAADIVTLLLFMAASAKRAPALPVRLVFLGSELAPPPLHYPMVGQANGAQPSNLIMWPSDSAYPLGLRSSYPIGSRRLLYNYSLPTPYAAVYLYHPLRNTSDVAVPAEPGPWLATAQRFWGLLGNIWNTVGTKLKNNLEHELQGSWLATLILPLPAWPPTSRAIQLLYSRSRARAQEALPLARALQRADLPFYFDNQFKLRQALQPNWRRQLYKAQQQLFAPYLDEQWPLVALYQAIPLLPVPASPANTIVKLKSTATQPDALYQTSQLAQILQAFVSLQYQQLLGRTDRALATKPNAVLQPNSSSGTAISPTASHSEFISSKYHCPGRMMSVTQLGYGALPSYRNDRAAVTNNNRVKYCPLQIEGNYVNLNSLALPAEITDTSPPKAKIHNQGRHYWLWNLSNWLPQFYLPLLYISEQSIVLSLLAAIGLFALYSLRTQFRLRSLQALHGIAIGSTVKTVVLLLALLCSYTVLAKQGLQFVLRLLGLLWPAVGWQLGDLGLAVAAVLELHLVLLFCYGAAIPLHLERRLETYLLPYLSLCLSLAASLLLLAQAFSLVLLGLFLFAVSCLYILLPKELDSQIDQRWLRRLVGLLQRVPQRWVIGLGFIPYVYLLQFSSQHLLRSSPSAFTWLLVLPALLLHVAHIQHYRLRQPSSYLGYLWRRVFSYILGIALLTALLYLAQSHDSGPAQVRAPVETASQRLPQLENAALGAPHSAVTRLVEIYVLPHYAPYNAKGAAPSQIWNSQASKQGQQTEVTQSTDSSAAYKWLQWHNASPQQAKAWQAELNAQRHSGLHNVPAPIQTDGASFVNQVLPSSGSYRLPLSNAELEALQALGTALFSVNTKRIRERYSSIVRLRTRLPLNYINAQVQSPKLYFANFPFTVRTPAGNYHLVLGFYPPSSLKLELLFSPAAQLVYDIELQIQTRELGESESAKNQGNNQTKESDPIRKYLLPLVSQISHQSAEHIIIVRGLRLRL